MLTTEEIRTFIANDEATEKKRMARIGQAYYEAEHDIKKHRIYFINAQGDLEEDKLKSNVRISHAFFTELVDQAVQYILSCKQGFIRSDDADLQEELDAYFNENEDFIAELHEILTGAQAKGFEYAYAYKDKDGKTVFECADSLGVVEVRAKDTQDKCDYVIHWYTERIEKDKEIKRIEVWDENQVTYFCQVDDGEITFDDSQELNPRPHTVLGKGEKLYQDSYGHIPFYRLDNNPKQQSALKPIKDLIDDYDMMACGLSNSIHDTNEALYVVHGFEGDNLDEIMKNIKAKKHIGVSEEGSVDIKTVDIPVDARRAKLEIDEKDIFRFGMGLNTADLKDTSATTNIAIKAAYSLLDLKANKLEIRLKQFLRKLIAVVLEEVNKAKKTDYQQSDVYFDFEDKDLPTNALENAQIALTEAQKRQVEINTILNLQTVIDDETRLQLIAEQLDLDYNDLKDKAPKPEDDPTVAAQQALQGIVPEQPVIEGDVSA